MMHTTDTADDTNAVSSYTYHVPDLTDEVVREFLRRSQLLASDTIADELKEYRRRILAEQPYEDAVSPDEFRERYLGR